MGDIPSSARGNKMTFTTKTKFTIEYTNEHFAPGNPNWLAAWRFTGTAHGCVRKIAREKDKLNCDISVRVANSSATFRDLVEAVNQWETEYSCHCESTPYVRGALN